MTRRDESNSRLTQTSVSAGANICRALDKRQVASSFDWTTRQGCAKERSPIAPPNFSSAVFPRKSLGVLYHNICMKLTLDAFTTGSHARLAVGGESRLLGFQIDFDQPQSDLSEGRRETKASYGVQWMRYLWGLWKKP